MAFRSGKNQKENDRRSGEKKPVYTAVYKVQRSALLLEFLLFKVKKSRNVVKSLLSERKVLVNGSVVSQFDFPLAKDDEVEIAKEPVARAPRARVEKRAVQVNVQGEKRRKDKTAEQMKIIYEDDDFLAVDKPAGLLSVESDKESDCAYRYVLSYLQASGKTVRPFVLHRIDKETSGVLVFAKNIKLHSMLKMHWNELVKIREYYAVVEGKTEKEKTIVSYLKENQNHIVYATHDPSGQKAITRYTALSRTEKCSLLKVEIDTGRKNQIRVQMQADGHPVLGDEKYGEKKKKGGRLYLHASKLVFLHPVSGKEIELKAPVPSSFFALFPKN